ncbi:hypothetical protein K440DRAFT_611917 [Wilcoxina mikolae CBS 423.85]|nr:hypothetical protein K440DRAFT_611917 [Wilcoxina mikolae CBS 423.85]
MVPRPFRQLGLPHEPAFISIWADGQMVVSAKESPRSKGKVKGQKSEGNRMSKTKRRVVDDG